VPPAFREISQHFQPGGVGPERVIAPVSLRLQERILVGLIGFIVIVVVAFLFGLLVLTWRH
jgi:hypothetical protein